MFSRPTAPEEGQEPEAPSTSGRARGAAPRLADDASVPAQRPYAKAEPGVARVFLARELTDALLFLAGAGDAAGDAAAGPKVKAHFKRYFPNTHYRDCVKVVAELREDERTWEGGRCAARPRLHGPRLQPAGTCGRARRAPEPPAPEPNPAPAGTTTRTTTGRCCARAGPRRAGTAAGRARRGRRRRGGARCCGPACRPPTQTTCRTQPLPSAMASGRAP